MKKKTKKKKKKKKKNLQYSLNMIVLEIRSKSMPLVSFDPSKVFVTKHIRPVPSFQEKEVDKYFLHFEKVAWPKEHWTFDYDTVKDLIFKAFEIST